MALIDVCALAVVVTLKPDVAVVVEAATAETSLERSVVAAVAVISMLVATPEFAATVNVIPPCLTEASRVS